MSLNSDEHVIYTTRFSKRIFVKPVALSVLAVVVACFSHTLSFGGAMIVFWAFNAVAILALVAPFTKYFFSQFEVTNQRVIIRHGFIARTTYEMVLKKIESIAVNQSLTDRLIWGSGTLVITGTGGTKEEFPNVGGAVEFQERLNEALNAA